MRKVVHFRNFLRTWPPRRLSLVGADIQTRRVSQNPNTHEPKKKFWLRAHGTLPSWSHLLTFLGLLLFFFLTKFSRSPFCNCSARAKLFKKKTPTCPACRTNCIQDNISMRHHRCHMHLQTVQLNAHVATRGIGIQ
jgi:hypothetical protein